MGDIPILRGHEEDLALAEVRLPDAKTDDHDPAQDDGQVSNPPRQPFDPSHGGFLVLGAPTRDHEPDNPGHVRATSGEAEHGCQRGVLAGSLHPVDDHVDGPAEGEHPGDDGEDPLPRVTTPVVFSGREWPRSGVDDVLLPGRDGEQGDEAFGNE